MERLGGVGALRRRRTRAADRQGNPRGRARATCSAAARRRRPTACWRRGSARKAVELVRNGQFGMMVANRPPDIVPVPFAGRRGEDEDRAARQRPRSRRRGRWGSRSGTDAGAPPDRPILNPAYRVSSSASFFFCSSSICLISLVGDLLHLVEAPLLVVLRHLLVLGQLLQPIVGVAADDAHGVARLLGHLVDVAGQFLAALVGERRDGDADDLAVVVRVQAEVRGADGLLDRAHQRRVERLRDDHRRLGHRERGHLVERHAGAVGVHVDRVEDARCSPARCARPPGRGAGARWPPFIRFLTSACRLLRSFTSMCQLRQWVGGQAVSRP